MRRLMLAALLALLLPSAPVLAQDEPAYRPPQPPRGSRVAVYRGNVRQSAPPVAIYRGSAAPPGRPAAVGTAPLARAVTVAGSRLWLVDAQAGKVTGCRLARTLQVGGSAVRCTQRRLELE